MHLKPFLLFLLLLFSSGVMAQDPPSHSHTIYQSPEGKLYVNKNEPIYLRIAASPGQDTTTHLLRSEATEQYANPMYFDKEGLNTIRSPWKVDPQTKEYVRPRQDIVFEVYADSKPPKSSISWETDNTLRKEHTIFVGEQVNLSFQSDDALSGTAAVYYSLNNSPFEKFDQPLQLNQEQVYKLKYYAVDHVGNAEKPHASKIILDLNAPDTRMKVEGERYQEVISGGSEIVLEAEDQITDIRQTYYKLDNEEMKRYSGSLKASEISEGAHTLVYYSTDKVNNQEKKKQFDFYVDKTPPRVIEEITGNTYTASGREYLSGRNKLKFISMDNKAGIREIRYSINDGEFKVYNKPVALTEGGNLKIETIAVDRVNNKKRTQKLTNRSGISYVDLTGPKLNHEFEGPVFQHQDSTFITSRTDIGLQGRDNESGFKTMEYATGTDQQPVAYTEPFSLEQEGLHHIRYTGFDNLDNRSSRQFSCRVDNEGPAIYHRFSSPSHHTREIEGKKYPVYPSHVVVFLSATDAGAGFERIVYTLNGSKPQDGSTIKDLNQHKLYHLKVTAVDKLGNESKKKFDFYVD